MKNIHFFSMKAELICIEILSPQYFASQFTILKMSMNSHFRNSQKFINSLRPSDANMHQWSKPPLADWARKWLAAYSAPSHYQNQYRHIVKWPLETNVSKIRIKTAVSNILPQHIRRGSYESSATIQCGSAHWSLKTHLPTFSCISSLV